MTINVLLDDPSKAEALLHAMDTSGKYFYLIELPRTLPPPMVERIDRELREATQGNVSFLLIPMQFMANIQEMDLQETQSFRDSLVTLMDQVIAIQEKYGPTPNTPPVCPENQP